MSRYDNTRGMREEDSWVGKEAPRVCVAFLGGGAGKKLGARGEEEKESAPVGS